MGFFIGNNLFFAEAIDFIKTFSAPVYFVFFKKENQFKPKRSLNSL